MRMQTHARPGHGYYLAATPGVKILKSRLGNIAIETLAYGQRIVHNGVTISLHPAGHVLGSSQVRLEYSAKYGLRRVTINWNRTAHAILLSQLFAILSLRNPHLVYPSIAGSHKA